ncbi:hypothetical protein CLOM_g1231 [Closterium sp. NIES-68]|nr:hypothetical protein CLOM_g1231 [Closterium sp. NIES-68]GJP67228.1 hypothetical protein CLOP_g24074 [Closterium sp. NIES-67]
MRPHRQPPEGSITRVVLSIHDGRVAAKTVPYNEQVKQLCRSLPDRRWDQSNKVWTFPIAMAADVERALRTLPRVHVEPLPLLPAPPHEALPHAGPAGMPRMPAGMPHMQHAMLQPCSHRSMLQPSAQQLAGTDTTERALMESAAGPGHVQVLITRATDGLLGVQLKPYNELVKDVCKSLPNRFWDNGNKQWKYPFQMADEVVAALACVTDVAVQIVADPPSLLSHSDWGADEEEPARKRLRGDGSITNGSTNTGETVNGSSAHAGTIDAVPFQSSAGPGGVNLCSSVAGWHGFAAELTAPRIAGVSDTHTVTVAAVQLSAGASAAAGVGAFGWVGGAGAAEVSASGASAAAGTGEMLAGSSIGSGTSIGTGSSSSSSGSGSILRVAPPMVPSPVPPLVPSSPVQPCGPHHADYQQQQWPLPLAPRQQQQQHQPQEPQQPQQQQPQLQQQHLQHQQLQQVQQPQPQQPQQAQQQQQQQQQHWPQQQPQHQQQQQQLLPLAPWQQQQQQQVVGQRQCRRIRLLPSSNGRVAASFVFHQDLLAPMKSVPCSIWQQEKRLWVFPLSSLDAFFQAVQSVPTCDVEVEPLPPVVQRALEETAKLPDDSGRFFDLPDDFRKLLMPFQEQGMQFALSRGGRVLIADEMGLGKTVQAIGLAACYHDEWPVLVVTPSSLRLHWAMSIVRWLNFSPEDITVVMPQGGAARSLNGFNFVRCARNQPLSLQSPFNIVSYDLLDRLEQEPERPFKVVIADESHYLKNYKAKRTGLAVPRLQAATRAILLTGTPALSRPIDLFKQLEALLPRAYRKLGEYGKRYCQGGRFGEFTGSSNLEELHAVLSGTVMIRRLKKQVLPQLPAKRRQQVLLMLEDKAMKPIRVLQAQLKKVRERKAAAGDAADGESPVVLEERALVSKLYSETAEAKVDAVREYLGTVLEAGCKFLVFAHHMTMMDALSDFFQKEKVGVIRIDGGTAPEKRQQLVDRFQAAADVQVALLGIHAAGVGLTLTAASTVVFTEMAWNPGDLVQAEDRAHRIGQANAVNIYYLHAPETIDDLIWSVVQHKLENLGQVMDGEHNQSLHVHKDPRHAASSASSAARRRSGGEEQEQGSGKWGGLTHGGVTHGGVTHGDVTHGSVTVAGGGGGDEKKRQRTISEMFQPPA